MSAGENAIDRLNIGLIDRLKSALGIILLSVEAAVIYGILHDQITVRICLEYFTIGHVPIFGDQPPTLLAILWGFVATWWMGLFLGVILAVAATAGRRPIRTARSLFRPVTRLLVVMACIAVVSGVSGYFLSAHGLLQLSGYLKDRVPVEKQTAFIADAAAHDASYLVGFFGGLFLAFRTWRLRKKIEPPAHAAGD